MLALRMLMLLLRTRLVINGVSVLEGVHAWRRCFS